MNKSSIKTIAWQEDFADETGGFWDEETIESTISTADWAPATPTGIRILNHNGEDIGCNGITNNRLITVDWDNNTEFDLHHYDYQNKDGGTIAQPTVSEITDNIRDLDGSYWYQVRAVSDSDNSSDWTEWCYVTLDRTMEDAGEREVIINEIMWPGSSEGGSDEWIELYNRTTREIKLKNWEIAGAGSGGDSIILPAGATISPGGYYLIANYADNDSDSALGVTVDFVTTTLDLSDGGEDLQLIDAFENVIDRAGTSTGWLAGDIEEKIEGEEGTGKWRSMERGNTPGNGTGAGDWHTCIDALCNDTTYWDIEGNDYGTPGSENHSENDLSSEDRDKEEELEILENIADLEEESESKPANILGASTISQTDPPVLTGTTEEEGDGDESLPAEEVEENQEPEINPEDSQLTEEESTEEESTEEEAVENTEEEPTIEDGGTTEDAEEPPAEEEETPKDIEKEPAIEEENIDE